MKDISVNRALWFGIGFSLLFTGLIWLTGELWLQPPEFAPRQTGAIVPKLWYPWQSAEPVAWTRVSVWTLYALHQVAIWFLIYKAQTGDYTYSANLHWFNVAALGVNALFITLHLVQTHLWYDGLALDVPEFTSQASVVLMLVAILIMENPRRGLFFGRQMPVGESATRAIRKYHGYYFAWAIIYTFWYHPMEITGGHLLGFLYMFLLLLQGSLFFTRMHVNPKWTIVAELSVVVHGVMVAYIAGQEWGRFFGGFLGIFVVTQMHGLGLSKAMRWAIGLGYIAALAIVYSFTQTLFAAWEALMIPAVEFLLVFVVSALVFGLTRVFGTPKTT